MSTGLAKKAWGVIGEAKSVSPITVGDNPFNTANKTYFKRVNWEALSLPFPRLTKHLRERFWLRQVAFWATQLNVKQIHECVDLMCEKNKLYGNRQIYVMGTLGILIRSIDKLERIKNIDSGATSSLLDKESRHDSVMDLFNYSILAVLCIRKEL